MSAIDNDYYLLYPVFHDEGMVFLKPDDATARRHYLSEELNSGKPLIFENGFADRLEDPSDEKIEDFLGAGLTFGVHDRVREVIEPMGLEGVQFYPMIFRDSAGKDHYDWYFLNIFEMRPFLDRKASMLLPQTALDAKRVVVMKFSLDAEAIAAAPEAQRHMFLLDGVLNGTVVVHASVFSKLEAAGISGYQAFKLPEFQAGMQE